MTLQEFTIDLAALTPDEVRAWALDQMEDAIEWSEGDAENAHDRADGILCKLLEQSGYADVVEKFRKVRKWYS